MEKLRTAWAVTRGAARIQDPGRRREAIRGGYYLVLVSAGRIVLEAERRGRDPLGALLAASGAVE